MKRISGIYMFTVMLQLFNIHFLLSAVCMMSCVASIAQNNLKHEVSMGCGYGKLMELKKWSDENDKWRSPSLHFQYLYNINRHLGIGAMLDYAYSSWNIDDAEPLYKYTNKDYKEKESTKWFSFGPTARVYWLNHDYFAMYSRMSVCILYASGHDSGRHTMFTISPVSLEWGGGNLRYFTEILSIGSLGLINGGIKYSF